MRGRTMRRMQCWRLGWSWVAGATMACSSSVAPAPRPTAPLPTFGAPEDFGWGPSVTGEPLIEVAAPTLPWSCRPEAWLRLSRIGQSVLPMRAHRRLPVVDALPNGRELPELAVAVGERRVLDVAGGALVAIDQGEFGAGLYHVPTDADHAEALDAHLSHRIHWIGQANGRIYGVSGLCHGEGCARHQRSVVFEVRLDPIGAGDDMRQGWRLDPIAVLPGCPEQVAIDGAEHAVLIATCHGLFRVDDLTPTTLVTWPSWLAAVDIAEVRGVDAPIYFVSFGALLGRFDAGRASWFSVPECVQK